MFPDTVAGLIKNRVSDNGASLLLQRKDGWSWKQITWKDFETDVKSVAAFIADAGFKPGDRAFFEACGTYYGLVAETAVLMLGGVAASRFPLADGAAGRSKVAFALNRERALRIAGRGEAEKVIFYSDGAGAKPDGAITDFRAAVKFGFLKSRKMTDLLENMFLSVRPDSTAVEVQNGNGSLQTLSQGGFMKMLEGAARRTAGFLNGNSQTFCHLPRADMFSRAVKFLSVCACARVAAAESAADFFEDILEVMPTVVFLDSQRLGEIAISIGEKTGARADKSVFGGRLERILTDCAPEGSAAEFYSKMGIEIESVKFDA